MKRLVLEIEKSREASENAQEESRRDTSKRHADSQTKTQHVHHVHHVHHVQSAPTSQTHEKLPQRKLPQVIPPEIFAVVDPSLKYGAAAGALGLFLGTAFGIVRSAPPVLFSMGTGFQWFALASSYSASRLVITNSLTSNVRPLTLGEEIGVSATAGGIAGTIGGLIRGPRNIVPGLVVFSLAGAGGQALLRRIQSRKASSESKSFWSSLSQYSPLTRLADEDYKKIIEERLLKVEADIAVVDGQIEMLRAAGEEQNDGAKQSTECVGQRPGKY